MSNLLTRIKGLFFGGRDVGRSENVFFSWTKMKLRVEKRSIGVEN